jgi:hypothetical protein
VHVEEEEMAVEVMREEGADAVEMTGVAMGVVETVLEVVMDEEEMAVVVR